MPLRTFLFKFYHKLIQLRINAFHCLFYPNNCKYNCNPFKVLTVWMILGINIHNGSNENLNKKKNNNRIIESDKVSFTSFEF